LPPAARKSEGGLSAAGQKVALSNIPQRNPFFTGREQVLAQLQEALARKGRAVLSGLGGVGKTQTVVEYAHRHSQEYTHAFWATADSRKAVGSGYATIVRLLGLREGGMPDQTLAVEAMQRWLSTHQNWLLVLDNADDLAMTREFIPPGNNGHVILTTRERATGAIGLRLDIEEMGTDEGALFLLRRAKYVVEDAPLDASESIDRAKAKEIALELGGLPLALDQAGAYIEETACGLSAYLDLYRKHAPDLLRFRGTPGTGHPDSVASTWALSFEKIEKANPAAAELLKFCAFLHPDAIPEEVLREGSPELGPVLGVVASDDLALNRAISEILKYSLLRRDPNSRTLEIHRLVQAVLRQGMDEVTLRLWAERAVQAVNRVFPDVEFSTWALCERLLAQAHACAALIDQWRLEFPEAARLLNQAGRYLFKRGHHTDTERFYKQSLAIREKTLGAEHPDVAWSLHNLAGLYRKQRQYNKAEPLYERARAIWEKVDSELPEVARNLNSLAALYRDTGQYQKAESLLERALAIWEKRRGPEQAEVARGLHSLGSLYRTQRQYSRAEPLYKRALAILEKCRDPGHPDVAQTHYRLAQLYDAQGQCAKADSSYQRALAIWEKALGPEHPDVAACLENYALLLRKMDRPQQAEPLETRARAFRGKNA
jgi:tetratricopeptide (TPR) repeat protein